MSRALLAALAWSVSIRHGLRVLDGGRLAAARGPLILVSNHRSRLDTVFYHHAVGARLTVCGARAAYFRSPARRWLMRLLNVRPAGDRRRFVADCLSLLDESRIVLLYPEMRTNRDGLGEFRDWAARVAIDSGAPVLPCAITARTRGERTAPGRRPRISIIVGEPIATTTGRDAAELTGELRERVLGLARGDRA